jgi:hypothetical protein
MRLSVPLPFKYLTIGIIILMGSSFALGQEKSIYRFQGGNDGQNPYAGLVSDKAGNLYGTTLYGGGGSDCGQKGCGTVYELTRRNQRWEETVVYSFKNGTDGSLPTAPLVFDKLGNLYGIALNGGPSLYGTIFELTPPAQQGGAWTETTLYSFTEFTTLIYEGFSSPGLILDSAGNLYGETPGLASNSDNGRVFQLAPPATQGGSWTYSVLYSFKGSLNHDGQQPEGGLRIDKSGNLYGATEFGGISSICATGNTPGCGTVFELKHPAKQGGTWTEKILYVFTGQNDGGQPVGGVRFAPNGGLYGTTFERGSQNLGVVFQLTAPKQGGEWQETVLYTFLSSDGGHPNSGLVFDKSGTLYGTTFSSLQSKTGGSVFQLTPPQKQGEPWDEGTLWGFNGGGSTSGVILNNAQNALYGTLTRNGIGNMGIVYTVALP